MVKPLTLADLLIGLFDTNTGELLGRIEPGKLFSPDIFDGRQVSVAITAADENVEGIGSVRLTLVDDSSLENIEPYALFGDVNGVFRNGEIYDSGNYSLGVEVYSEARGGGSKVLNESIPFSLGAAQSEPKDVTVFLVETESDTIVADISDGEAINVQSLQTGKFAIVVEADEPNFAEQIGSVRLTYGDTVKVENFSPYALFGDADGGRDILGDMGLDAGNQEVKVEIYSDRGAKGSMLMSETYAFNVTGPSDPAPEPVPPAPPPPPPQPAPVPTPPPVADKGLIITLVDTETDTVVETLNDGDDLSSLDQGSYTIVVNAEDDDFADQIGSVRLTYGDYVQTENLAPYALFGDSGGDFRDGVQFYGEDQQIRVEVFSGSNGTGNVLTTESLSFDGPEPPVTEPPEPEPDPEPTPPPPPPPSPPPSSGAADGAVATDAEFDGIRLWVSNDISEVDDVAGIAPLMLGAKNIANSDDNITGSADKLHFEGVFVDTNGRVSASLVDDVERVATEAADAFDIDIYAPRSDFNIGGGASQWEQAMRQSLDTAFANDEQFVVIAGGATRKAGELLAEWLDDATGDDQAEKAAWVVQGGFTQVTHGWTYQDDNDLDYTRDPSNVNSMFNLRTTDGGPQLQPFFEDLYQDALGMAQDGIGSAFSQAEYNAMSANFVDNSLIVSIENQNFVDAVRGDADVIAPRIDSDLVRETALDYSKSNGTEIDFSDVGMLAILQGDEPFDLDDIDEILDDGGVT
ncbi:MAG: hypothetical protein AAGA87_05715 [Pseudomonadota bacterium]